VSETPTRTRNRRLGIALVATLALVAVACEQNADGSFSVEQAYLCVRTDSGDIRWTANKDCTPQEILVRVDEPQAAAPADPGPQPRSWDGTLAMGATSPAVSADGAARSFVHLAVADDGGGPDDYPACSPVIQGATTSVYGESATTNRRAPITVTVEWADPSADNSVAVTCTGVRFFTAATQVSLELIPTG